MADSLGLNYEMTEFSGEAPVFPLPDVVFFPKTLLPLHIFESRYREMTRDVLRGERIICVTLLKSPESGEESSSVPIYEVGTLGYIEKYKLVEDGKYNILLNGLTKVRIHEYPQVRSYRTGQMEVIDDNTNPWNINAEREKLMDQFRYLSDLADNRLPLQEIQESNVSLEVLVNLLATWLPIPMTEKQKLLEINDIVLRSEIVREFLRQEIEDLSFLDDLDIPLPEDPKWN